MDTTFAAKMLGRALASLDKAASAKTPGGTFVAAYRAAEEAAAAVITARISAERRSQMPKPGSMWEALLFVDRAEMAGWARYFKAYNAKFDLAKTGAPGVIDRDEAEELLRDVTSFLITAEGIVQHKEAS